MKKLCFLENPFLVLLLCILILPFCFSSCNTEGNEKTYRIGFSQCIASDKWRKSMEEGMRRELAFHPGVQFLYKDADGNNEKQIQQVQELMYDNIDLLIISPNEAGPLTPIVEEVFNKGIPVIVVDRKIASSLYTAYVGADNYEIGKLAGEYSANILKGKGNVLEVMGLPGSSPTLERQKGFDDAVKPYPGINITKVHGNWLKQDAFEAASKFAETNNPVQLVFGQNDVMTLGSYEAFKKAGRAASLKFVGVDGLGGPGAGIEFVTDKILTATVLYPTGGEEAIQTAMAILNKQNFRKENILQTLVIDSSNVRIMKLQADKINSQQIDIERGQQMLDEQRKIYHNQTTVLITILITLVIAVTLGGIAFYSLRENRKINKKLEQKNKEILEHQDQLLEMSAKAQAANEAKINFFTNISHEFRTPLTLILGPLEELLNNPKLHYITKQYLSLIQKNTIRLLRLVNELIDFRKIEVNKMQLRASENDLVLSTHEIVETFRATAKKRNIDLRMITKERSINIWFDTLMLDKVLFNLLSNAFKFTNDNGYIYITLEKNEPENIAVIKVEDNGIGMSQDVAEHAFELFYQAGMANKQGSGLGLPLSKELINLHHGSISVTSKQWKGTCFEIRLPLGTAHLREDEMTTEKSTEELMYSDERIFNTEPDTAKAEIDESMLTKADAEQYVLIIEDNADLRNFLGERLRQDYQVIDADNGTIALQQAFDNVPDLIISDVILPGKDGFTVTNTLKNDIRTSHIPIILLTAKIEIEEQIEGMKNLADAYIVKPFNLQFLEETVKSVMKNREILREHYTSELPIEFKSQAYKKLDRKFINDFTAIVENNIGNDKFNVDEICKTIGVSRIQLYRKVKALLGANVNDYILTARLQKAKYLLNSSEMSIAEIAFKVGFSSSAYFSTVFKSRFHVTPTEFRET